MSDQWKGKLKARNYHVEYYEEHKNAGLDYLVCSGWQKDYGTWLVQSLGWAGKDILDVGCACGAITEGIRQAGAKAYGVDLNNHTIALGRKQFPRVPLYVCDAVNLHLFGDNSFDGIHCAQVAEHWRPELVPFILKELARVLKPDGMLFLCLDTEELFDRQGREGNGGDPTHVCIKPQLWWVEQTAGAGLQPEEESEMRMIEHPKSYFPKYDWDWFLLRKPTAQ